MMENKVIATIWEVVGNYMVFGVGQCMGCSPYGNEPQDTSVVINTQTRKEIHIGIAGAIRINIDENKYYYNELERYPRKCSEEGWYCPDEFKPTGQLHSGLLP